MLKNLGGIFVVYSVQYFVVFSQPVQCEGAIETWLNSLVSAIKTALQYQLATATGVEKPVESRSINSAGARKVQLIQEKQSKQQQARGEHVSELFLFDQKIVCSD